MSSEQAVKYGLIDTVLQQRTEITADEKDDSD
jgi:ATP-dependent protease ClpP protease subunit